MSNLEYKDLEDSIKIFRDKSITRSIKFRRLNEIADMLELYKYSDTLKHEFVDGSLIKIMEGMFKEWCEYFTFLLLHIEDYELLATIKKENLFQYGSK